MFIERLAHGEWHGGYLDFLTQRVFQFQPYPAGDFSWHHLWFIIYLYVVRAAAAAADAVVAARAARAAPGRVAYALALPLGINEALLKPLFPETHNLVSDWYIFNHYLLLTLYGFVLASMPGAWDWLARRPAPCRSSLGHRRLGGAGAPRSRRRRARHAPRTP